MTLIPLNSPDAPDYYAEYIQTREDLQDAKFESGRLLNRIMNLHSYISELYEPLPDEPDWDKISFLLASQGIALDTVLQYVCTAQRNEIIKQIGEIINE